MLAYELGRDVEEVEEWVPDKIAYWLAFFKLTNKRREKEQADRQKGKRRR